MTQADLPLLPRVMGLMCEAIALRGADQHSAALAALDGALTLDAGFIPAHLQRAALLEEMGDMAAAVVACEACLDIAPSFDDARQTWQRLLLALIAQCEQGRADGATTRDSRLDYVEAQAHFKLGQLQAALPAVQRALLINPDDFPAVALQADILLRLNRHEEALAWYDQVSVAPGSQRALLTFNRADILRQMNQVEQARACYAEALALHPGWPQAEVGLAHMQLMQGDFMAGWRGHEARYGIAELARRRIRSDAPRWQVGDDIRDRHVLLWAEQGLGDSLQFARYIGLVQAQAAAVTICVPPGLLPLLAPAFPGCNFVVNDKAPPPHDLYASLLSLPWLLQLPDPSEGPATPYLYADPALVTMWQERLHAVSGADAVNRVSRRLRIGVAWAGRQYATIHASRDMALTRLTPLFALPADFVSLQPQLPAGDVDARDEIGVRLHEFPLPDWAHTAALVQCLDLVITVDTAVAHLAGALARPTLLMLRYEGEWRWGQQAQSTAWYPATHLLRQSVRGDWDDVVEQLLAICDERIASQA